MTVVNSCTWLLGKDALFYPFGIKKFHTVVTGDRFKSESFVVISVVCINFTPSFFLSCVDTTKIILAAESS